MAKLISLEQAAPGLISSLFANLTASVKDMPKGTTLTVAEVRRTVTLEGRRVGIDIAAILALIQAIMAMLKAFGLVKVSGRRVSFDIATILMIIQMVMEMLKQFGVIKK